VSTTSTASSSTDGPEPDGTDPTPTPGAGTPDPAGTAAAASPPAAAAQPDPGRRAFFKSFSRQAFTTAAQVVGMANAVSSATTNVAVGVVGLAMDPEGAAERIAAPATPSAPAPAPAEPPRAPVGHRSPFRLDGDVLYLLDQRGLPDRLDEQVCRRGSDVAFYLRVMAVRGGPIVGQLAAYGLAMTAKEFAPRTWHARQAEWKRVCRALMAARTGNRMLRFALDRMSAVHDQFGPDADPLAVAAALRAEADTLTLEAQHDHATIARTLAELLPRPADRPLTLLVHGAPGTSTGGHIGTALNAIALLAQDEVPLKVYITETRPYLEGGRLATWELGPTGAELVVIPDAAIGYVLDTLPVDAVLLGAEWIAANGDTSNVAGSRMIAEVAAAARRGPVPVYVAAPATTIDPAMATGEGIPIELRPGREIVTHITGWKPERPSALIPSQDVIPASRITAIVTELGGLAPEREALLEAASTRAAKRAVIPPAYVAPAPDAATQPATDDGPPTPDGRAPGSPDDDEDEDDPTGATD
jgi:methylthioribose-1-phosphate isomerase